MARITIGRKLDSSTDSVSTIEKSRIVDVPHDFIGLSYDPNGLLSSAIFKQGGSGGTTVKTLTFAYGVNDLLESVTAT